MALHAIMHVCGSCVQTAFKVEIGRLVTAYIRKICGCKIQDVSKSISMNEPNLRKCLRMMMKVTYKSYM